MLVADNNQAGFTMVELLVAVVILAVGLLGLAQLQVTAIKTNSQSGTITAANAIAQKVIEEIVALPAGDPQFDAASFPASGTWPGSPITVDGGGTYNITYEMTRLMASGVPVTNVLKVKIVVTSTTAVANVLGNKQRSVTTHTIKRVI